MSGISKINLSWKRARSNMDGIKERFRPWPTFQGPQGTTGCMTSFRTLSPACWYHKQLCHINPFINFSSSIVSWELFFFQIIIPTSRLCNILISSDIWKLSSVHQLKAIPWWACIHFVKFQYYPLIQISCTLLFFITWCLFTSDAKISLPLDCCCAYMSLWLKFRRVKFNNMFKAELMLRWFKK